MTILQPHFNFNSKCLFLFNSSVSTKIIHMAVLWHTQYHQSTTSPFFHVLGGTKHNEVSFDTPEPKKFPFYTLSLKHHL